MSLRAKAIKGGAFLFGRQAIGIVLSVIGVLIVTRIIGPRQYGIFAAGQGIVVFLATFGPWGIDVYLLRKSEEPTSAEFRQAFTLLLCLSLVCTIPAILLRRQIAAFIRMPEAGPVLAVLALSIPFSLLGLTGIVKLDRDLNFKQVAFNELVSQLSLYAVAIPLAIRGLGAWAPTAGYVTQQVLLCVLSIWSSKIRPGLHWEMKVIRDMLNYGLSFSVAGWIWQLRNLVNPVIVGRFAGAEAVGYVAVATRIVGILAIAKMVTWRVAMAALAKLGGNAERLRRSIEEGMRLQAIAVGLPLSIFAILAPAVVPAAFGNQWTPVLKIFPFIALNYFANSVFILHSSVLLLLQKNWKVAWFNGTHVVLFIVGCLLMVPRFGYMGYGWAEIGALTSYIVLHAFILPEVGSVSYTTSTIWFATMVGILTVCSFGVPLCYFALMFFALPVFFSRERESLIGYVQLLLSRTNESSAGL